MDIKIEEMAEWLKSYLISRDVIKKEIKEIKEEVDDKNSAKITVFYNDKKEKEFLIFKKIDDNFLLENNKFLVLLNSKKNFEWLINQWNKLVTYTDIIVYFINPASLTEHKWIINPHMHSKICDKSSFKQGLKSLFKTVDVV